MPCCTCSSAPHLSLGSVVSSQTNSYASHVSYLSCLVARMLLLLELFEFFTAWDKVNHCDNPFKKKNIIARVFRISDISLQDLLTSLQ